MKLHSVGSVGMNELIQNCALLLVLSLSIMSCSYSGHDISVSQRFGVCARLPGAVLHTPAQHGATDFEVTDLGLGSASGAIYVGDFPDFPKFNPDLKFNEDAGEVRYIGEAEARGVRNYLYRVGLGSQPSVHVLVQIPVVYVEFNEAWAQNAGTRISSCD